MREPRSYEDPCGIARALDVIGERWALLVVRELTLGPKRFTDVRGGLPGASPNVLSQRLRELEEAGIVQRRKAGVALYELTDWGRQLHPILLQLGRWGARSPARPSGQLSADALMLALEATFVAERAATLTMTVEVRLDDARFVVTVSPGAIDIAAGEARRPDAIIETDTTTLRAVVFGDLKLADANLRTLGDARLARQFLRLFARPAPARAP